MSDDDMTFLDGIKENDQRFQENNADLEAIIEGEIGFHAYFTDSGQTCRGAMTAVYQGIYDEIQEVHLDDELIEINHGEVTPKTVRAELMAQLDEFTYLPENMRESIGERVEERVRKRVE